ncbi:MAG: CDP-alcohol phosphatidyltransferase family protein [Candidatus Micrarchaeota archaeon]|nr:CDP-alcohol phosphatidyltransferase family protein [Candidatus Micrarchaeota archaeon]
MLKKTGIGVRFQKVLGNLFSCLPLSANQITVCALLLALIGFYFAYLQQPLVSLLFFILSGATDAIDGAVARARNEVSARGAYIDGMIDRLVEFLFACSFFFYALPPFILPTGAWIISFLFFGSCMTSFATAYADHRKVADAKKIARQPGILPRAERLTILFAALALVPFCPSCASFLLFCGALLAAITFGQRFDYFAE